MSFMTFLLGVIIHEYLHYLLSVIHSIDVYTLSASQFMSFLENNFVSLYLSLLSFNATLIIGLSIIPLPIYCIERNNRIK